MREIRAAQAVLAVSRGTVRAFLDLLQVEEERDIYAQGMRVLEYPDGATVEEIERLIQAWKES